MLLKIYRSAIYARRSAGAVEMEGVALPEPMVLPHPPPRGALRPLGVGGGRQGGGRGRFKTRGGGQNQPTPPRDPATRGGGATGAMPGSGATPPRPMPVAATLFPSAPDGTTRPAPSTTASATALAARNGGASLPGTHDPNGHTPASPSPSSSVLGNWTAGVTEGAQLPPPPAREAGVPHPPSRETPVGPQAGPLGPPPTGPSGPLPPPVEQTLPPLPVEPTPPPPLPPTETPPPLPPPLPVEPTPPPPVPQTGTPPPLPSGTAPASTGPAATGTDEDRRGVQLRRSSRLLRAILAVQSTPSPMRGSTDSLPVGSPDRDGQTSAPLSTPDPRSGDPTEVATRGALLPPPAISIADSQPLVPLPLQGLPLQALRPNTRSRSRSRAGSG